MCYIPEEGMAWHVHFMNINKLCQIIGPALAGYVELILPALVGHAQNSCLLCEPQNRTAGTVPTGLLCILTFHFHFYGLETNA